MLDRLRTVDTANVFALPVNVKDAPDYDKIVTNPMDFSTMEKKITSYSYKSMDAFEADMNLIISNCMLYNTRDTIFFRLALKMRDQGGMIIRMAKRDAERVGFDPESGFLLSKAPDIREKSPTSMLLEVDKLIDGEVRTDLSLPDQLKNLLEKLDFTMTLKNGIGKTFKAKKLRAEISKVRRKIAQQKKASGDGHTDNMQAQSAQESSDTDSERETNDEHEKKGASHDVKNFKTHDSPSKKHPSGKTHITEKENKFSLLPQPFSRSASMPGGPKKKSLKRKRLWSHISETDREAKRERRRSADAFSPLHINVKRSLSAAASKAATDNADSSNDFQESTASVNRRSAVLFNKKRKRNSHPVSRQNSDETRNCQRNANSKIVGKERALSDSAAVPTRKSSQNTCRNSDNGSRRSRSPKARPLPLRKTRSSDSYNSPESSESDAKTKKLRKRLSLIHI